MQVSAGSAAIDAWYSLPEPVDSHCLLLAHSTIHSSDYSTSRATEQVTVHTIDKRSQSLLLQNHLL